MLTTLWSPPAETLAQPDAAATEKIRRASQLAETGPAAGEAAQRSLVEQKTSLLRTYLGSEVVTRIEGGEAPAARELVGEARRLLTAAVSAIDQGRLDAASRDLDEALRKVSAAAKIGAHRKRDGRDAEARERYRAVRQTIGSYMRSLDVAPPQDDDTGQSRRLKAQVAELTEAAERLAGAGRYAEANELLSQAYRRAVLVVVEQSRGKTIVSRLAFATLGEELEYERKRNDSYEMLVQLMMSERPTADRGFHDLVAGFVDESRGLKQEAEAAASAGDHQSAIGKMEEATRRLIRALRTGGLPVPE